MSHQSRPGFSGKWFISAALLVFSSALIAASNDSHEDIIERIAPAGSVCLIGEACASGVSVASASGAGGLQDPEQIYMTYCTACHTTGANNSPVIGDAAAWEPRIEKGIDTLYQNAINGFNNNTMPPKGLCMDCSDEAIQATVDYIISAVQ